MDDRYFKLNEDHTVSPCDFMEWAKSRECGFHLADETINEVRVSTIFLGLDHSWGDGPPLLFETMIFGGPHDQYQDRCTTWEQAEEMHKRAVALVMEPSFLIK